MLFVFGIDARFGPGQQTTPKFKWSISSASTLHLYRTKMGPIELRKKKKQRNTKYWCAMKRLWEVTRSVCSHRIAHMCVASLTYDKRKPLFRLFIAGATASMCTMCSRKHSQHTFSRKAQCFIFFFFRFFPTKRCSKSCSRVCSYGKLCKWTQTHTQMLPARKDSDDDDRTPKNAHKIGWSGI